MSYASEVLADNPIWYLRFEETSGNPVDSSPGNWPVYKVGSPTQGAAGVTLIGGYAIGTGSGTSLYLDYTAGPHTEQTIEGWFKTTATGFARIEQNRGGPGQNGVCLQMGIGPTGFGASAGQVSAYFNATSFWQGVHTSSTVNDGQWHHIVATWSGTVVAANILIYIDGALASTTADSNTGSRSSPITGQLDMTILDGDETMTSDEMAFYSTQLSAARISAHYTSGAFTSVRSMASFIG